MFDTRYVTMQKVLLSSKTMIGETQDALDEMNRSDESRKKQKDALIEQMACIHNGVYEKVERYIEMGKAAAEKAERVRKQRQEIQRKVELFDSQLIQKFARRVFLAEQRAELAEKQLTDIEQKHQAEKDQMIAAFKKDLVWAQGGDLRAVSQCTRGSKRLRAVEKDTPTVHAEPWFCEKCDDRGLG